MDEEIYSTYDIGIAATLVILGVPLQSMLWDKSSHHEYQRMDRRGKPYRGRVVFRFSDPEEAKRVVNHFLCDNLQVNPQALITKMNEYRRLIYNKENLPVVE